ncbi:MAG: PAS domain S-box protein [Chitinophagales bacterium]
MLSPNESRLITEKYKGLDYLSLPIALADNSFSLLYFNSTFSRLFQQSSEVFPARDFNGLFENFSEKIEVLKQAGLSAGYLQNFIIPSVKLRSSGRFFDLHVAKFSPELDHLEGFSVTCVEVTEREKEINTLSESSMLHRSFMEHTNSGVIVHIDGIIQSINRRGAELLGVTSNESISGVSVLKFLAEDSKNQFSEQIKALSEKTVLSSSEYKLVKADGSFMFAEIQSFLAGGKNVNSVVTIFSDITDQQREKEKLTERSKQYHNLIESTRDVIFSVDTNLKFTFLNTAWKDLTGYSTTETLGKYCYDFLQISEGGSSLEQEIIKLLRPDTLPADYELEIKTKLGALRFAEAKFQALYSDNKNVIGLSGSIIDIHAKKLAQAELRHTEESSKRQNKTLLKLAKNETLQSGDFLRAIEMIAKECAEALQVSRVNIWQFDEQYKKLSCLMNFDRDTNRLEKTPDLIFEHCPKYFTHLLNEKLIECNNTLRDHRFVELKDTYCIPQGINSRLDVSVMFDDTVWGVISFEEKRITRSWTQEEQSFAKAATEFITMACKSVQKAEQEKASDIKDELYRILISQANDAIYVIDTNDKFWEVNESACLLMGYSREEMKGMEVKNIFPKRFIQAGKSVLEEVRQEKRFTKERILLCKNGDEIITELSSVVLPDGRIQGIARNVTERKQQEKALKESETRLELALKGAELGTWDFFIQEDRIFHNKRWGEILGYNFEMNVMNEQFMDKFVHPDDVRIVYDEFQKHLRGETPYYDVTIRMLASNGEYKWIQDKGKVVEWDENGNPVRASGIHQDVSALKTFEKEIQQQKNYLYQIIDAIPNPVYVKNANDEFAVVNKALADYLGSTVKTVMQYKSVQKEHFQKVLKVLFEKDTEVFLSKKPVILYEQEIPAGELFEKRWVQSIKVPLQDNDGNISEILSISTDITELKLKEHELAELNENLEQKAAERTGMLEIANKELETFNFSVSHDLRTPLRTIDIFAYFLEKNYKDKLEKEGSENIRQIRQSITKMSSLIDNLILYSKMGRQDVILKRVNVEDLIRDIIEDLKKDEDLSNVQFNITHLPLLYADNSMLRLALVNLISNAIKFTKTRPVPLIEFFGYVDEDSTTISIRDNGIGFSTELKEKLFKPFKRLHSDEFSDGTGVGLAIVEKIIKRHSGQVWAESEENKGSTFYIKLPGK